MLKRRETRDENLSQLGKTHLIQDEEGNTDNKLSQLWKTHEVENTRTEGERSSSPVPYDVDGWGQGLYF